MNLFGYKIYFLDNWSFNFSCVIHESVTFILWTSFGNHNCRKPSYGPMHHPLEISARMPLNLWPSKPHPISTESHKLHHHYLTPAINTTNSPLHVPPQPFLPSLRCTPAPPRNQKHLSSHHFHHKPPPYLPITTRQAPHHETTLPAENHLWPQHHHSKTIPKYPRWTQNGLQTVLRKKRRRKPWTTFHGGSYPFLFLNA